MKQIEVVATCTDCGRSVTWLAEVEVDEFVEGCDCDNALISLSQYCPVLPLSVNAIIKVNGVLMRTSELKTKKDDKLGINQFAQEIVAVGFEGIC